LSSVFRDLEDFIVVEATIEATKALFYFKFNF
jgi:hypothetical protein